MKKHFLTLIFLISLTTGYSQTQKPPDSLTVTFSLPEWISILEALGDVKTKTGMPLINKINNAYQLKLQPPVTDSLKQKTPPVTNKPKQ